MFNLALHFFGGKNRLLKVSGPANSHDLTVRLTAYGINSRSHDLASKSQARGIEWSYRKLCFSENNRPVSKSRDSKQESRNLGLATR